MGQRQLTISAPEIVVNVHLLIVQKIATQTREEGEAMYWSSNKISTGKDWTEISDADSSGDTKDAASVSFGSLINGDGEITSLANPN